MICFYFEIKREKLCKLFDKKRAGSDRDAFEESVRKFPALIIDPSQRTLVSLIKGLWDFIQGPPDPGRKAASEMYNLTINPSKPTIQ